MLNRESGLYAGRGAVFLLIFCLSFSLEPAARASSSPGEKVAGPARGLTPGGWKQLYHDASKHASSERPFPHVRDVERRARDARRRSRAFPIAVLDLTVEGEGTGEDARATLGDDSQIVSGTGRIFAASVLDDTAFQAQGVTFHMDESLCFSDHGGGIEAFEVDPDDGRGPRVVGSGETVTADYETVGTKTVEVRALLSNGEEVTSRFLFNVAALSTPEPHETWDLRADIPYEGGTATGTAFVYRSDENETIVNPVIGVEGFDIDNTMGWEELYAFMNSENLLNEMRAEGFDYIILDFDDPLDYVQRNAFLLVKLIERVNGEKSGLKRNVVIGASMGGLVARYALAYMGRNRMDHETRTFISFDAPQNGANIPLGIQHWIDFFTFLSAEAALYVDKLNSVSARQMLLYHHLQTAGQSAGADPLRGILMDELSSLQNYPRNLRTVAIANGSGSRGGLPFDPGAQILQYRYSAAPVASIVGNAWAVPDGGPAGLVFQGRLMISGEVDESETIEVSSTLPWDNAPGGTRGTALQLSSIPVPYGAITTNNPLHCFIPTISALDLSVSDPFHDVAGDGDLMEKTPFDALYFPSENQEHAEINAENAQWLAREIRGIRLYYPRVMSDDTWETELCVVNPVSSRYLSGVLRAYDAAGGEVTPAVSVSLGPRGRREVTVGEEFSDPGTIRYVVFETDAPEAVGYLKLSVAGTYRTALPAADSTAVGDMYVSHIDSDENWTTEISLVNLGDAAREVVIEFDDGRTRERTIAAGAYDCFTIAELFDGQPQPGLGSAVIHNAARMAGLELFRLEASNLLSGVVLEGDTASVMYYPHVESLRGWATGIVAYNPSEAASTLTITPYDGSGGALDSTDVVLEGRGRYIGLTVRDLGLPAEVQWMEVTATNPVAGFELFTQQNQMAGYRGVNIRGKEGIFPKVDPEGATGIAVVNVGDGPATVTFTGYDDSGAASAETTMTLERYVKWVGLLTDLFGDDGGTPTYVAYSSDEEMVGFQLNASSGGFELDGLPALR